MEYKRRNSQQKKMGKNIPGEPEQQKMTGKQFRERLDFYRKMAGLGTSETEKEKAKKENPMPAQKEETPVAKTSGEGEQKGLGKSFSQRLDFYRKQTEAEEKAVTGQTDISHETVDDNKVDAKKEANTKATSATTGVSENPDEQQTQNDKTIPDKGSKPEGRKSNTIAQKDEIQTGKQGTTQQKTSSIKSRSQSAPGDDRDKGATDKPEAGGSRLTNIKNRQFDGLDKKLSARIDQGKTVVKTSLNASTAPGLAKGKKAVEKTKKEERRVTPAVVRLKQAKDAEDIPQAAADTEKKQEKTKALSKREVKKTDKGATAQAVNKLGSDMADNLPQDKKALEDETFMEKFNAEAGGQLQELFDTVGAKTSEVSDDFKDIDNPVQGEAPPTAKPLPALEKARNTPLVATASMKKSVPDEQFRPVINDVRQASLDTLKKEGIGEGQAISYEEFRQAKSEDLRRGIDAHERIQEEATVAPDDIRKYEKTRHNAMEKSMKDKELVKRNQMRLARDEQLRASRGNQNEAKTAYEKKRAEITAQMDEVFNTARTAVSERLSKLDTEVKLRFEAAKKKALGAFSKNVEAKLSKFHQERYLNSKWNLIPTVLVVNLARWAFEDTSKLAEVIAIFEEERQVFVATIDQEVQAVTAHVESEVLACKKIIDAADVQLETIAKAQGKAFKQVTADAYRRIRKKMDKLNSGVNKKADELKKHLEAQRKKAIEEVDKKIAEIKERLKGLLNKVAGFLMDAAYKFFKWVLSSNGFSTEQIDQVINQGREVLTKIVTDPMGFLNNLISAVSLGFNNFVGNVGKHLKNGLFSWLTGAMSGAGLVLPQKWDMKGIFSVVLQVMGLSWTNIRAKIAKEVGEENLAKAEQATDAGLEIFQQIKEKGFVDAMWDMLVEKAGMIQQMVIDEVKNWLIVKVVQQAVTKILSMLNPAGIVMQAILAIFDFAMWLINNWERIVKIISGIISSVGKIAMGQLGEAAKFIETTLANFVPVLIDFLARLIGLGNVSERIKKIMLRLRKPIDELIDKIIGWIKGKLKGFGKKKGKKGKGKGKEDTKTKDKKLSEKDQKKQYARLKKIRHRFNIDKEKHTLYIDVKGKEVRLMVASNPATYQVFWGKLKGFLKNVVTLGYHGYEQKQKREDEEREKYWKKEAQEALNALPKLFASVNKAKKKLHNVWTEDAIEQAVAEIARHLIRLGQNDLLFNEFQNKQVKGSKKEFKKAWRAHMLDRKKLLGIMERGRHKHKENAASEDERMHNLRISNSIEWVYKKKSLLFVVTPVGQMEQRLQANGKEAAQKAAYFPNAYQGAGDVLSRPQPYNWENLKDNKNVLITSRDHLGARFVGSNRVYLMDMPNRTEKEVYETLVHEIQHAADRYEDFNKGKIEWAWQKYKTEFRAHYVSGEFDLHSDKKGTGSNGFKTKRQQEVAEQIVRLYPHSKNAWHHGVITENKEETPDNQKDKYRKLFQRKARLYVRPEQFGVNDVNSVRIDNFYNALKNMSNEGLQSPETQQVINTFVVGNSPDKLTAQDVQSILGAKQFKKFFRKAFDKDAEVHIRGLLTGNISHDKPAAKKETEDPKPKDKKAEGKKDNTKATKNKAKDGRTDTQKKEALEAAAKEVDKLTKNGKNTKKEIEKEFPKIKSTHQLTKIRLIEGSNGFKVHVTINPEWELPLPALHSSKEASLSDYLIKKLRFKAHDANQSISNMRQTKGSDKVADYILSGNYDTFDGYAKLIRKIIKKPGSDIPAVLQALDKANVFRNKTNIKEIKFEQEDPSGELEYDMDVVTISHAGYATAYQFKTTDKLKPRKWKRKLAVAIRQLFDAPADEKWAELKLVEQTEEEFLALEEGEPGSTVTVKKLMSAHMGARNINVRLEFSNGTQMELKA